MTSNKPHKLQVIPGGRVGSLAPVVSIIGMLEKLYKNCTHEDMRELKTQ